MREKMNLFIGNAKEKAGQFKGRTSELLKSKKGGSELVIFLVIIGVVVLLAVTALPTIMNSVNGQATKANGRIEGLDSMFD